MILVPMKSREGMAQSHSTKEDQRKRLLLPSKHPWGPFLPCSVVMWPSSLYHFAVICVSFEIFFAPLRPLEDAQACVDESFLSVLSVLCGSENFFLRTLTHMQHTWILSPTDLKTGSEHLLIPYDGKLKITHVLYVWKFLATDMDDLRLLFYLKRLIASIVTVDSWHIDIHHPITHVTIFLVLPPKSLTSVKNRILNI